MPEFTSNAVGTGGRGGRVWSESKSYEHAVGIPGVASNGVTPEELLAGAWAACFGGAFLLIAGNHGIDASAARFHTAVTLDSDLQNMRFDITRVQLEVELAGVDDATVDMVLAEAHDICPVSKLFVNGAGEVTLGRAAATA